MKTVSVREMKAKWSEIEKQVANGETFQVLNRGKPTVKIVPSGPRKIEKWPDFMATAIPNRGKSASEVTRESRERDWEK